MISTVLRKSTDPALTIGQAAVIQDLQQGVPHFRVGFFDLVKQDHPVGPAADGFGQLAAFFVADISGRRAKQAGDGVLFAVLAHIDPHQRVFIIEHELGQGFGQFGLADAGRPDKDKGTNRAAGVFQAGARPADGIGDGRDGFVLADDALVQALFHLQQFFCFGFHHLADRDAGPLGDHFGDIIHIHHFIQLVFCFPLIALFG